MSTRHEAVVIGAGHNGLVAALTLAAAGRRVVVVESSERIGGLCADREFHKGFHAPGLLQDSSTFRPELIRTFDLPAHGLELRDHEPPVCVADSDGGTLLLHRDPAAARDEIARLSAADAEAYAEWRRFLGSVGAVIRRLLNAPPPPLKPAGTGELWSLALTAFALRRLGRKTMAELLRVLPMNVADWLQENFESDLLCAGLAIPAVLGTFNGPWAAGTAAQLILQESSKSRSVAGGPAALVTALESAARAQGVEIRTSAPVARLDIEAGRIRAVELVSGESLETDLVIASCDPKQTLLQLVEARHVDSDTVRELESFRCRGTTAILHLAVQGPVDVASRAGEPIEHLRLGGETVDQIERAFDAAKYRQRSAQPHLEVHIPTIDRPELAPEGANVVTALVSCAPYDLQGGWDPTIRESLIADCVRQINDQIPGLRERLVSGELLAPPDLEAEYALPGGHLHHGEHAPDQLLFLRPTQHLARYATPIEGLYLGSSGCHPGGGVTGMPGRLAAQTALGA